MILVPKRKEPPIIFIDVDDTIADTRAAVASIYEKRTGRKALDIKSIPSKRYCDFCPSWTDKDVENLFKEGKEIYEVAKPLEGSLEAINYLLYKGYDVRIVTLNYPHSVGHKYNWIERHFPELQDRVYYVDWRMPNKDVFKGYAIIDDDLKNIKSNKSDYPILIDFYDIYNTGEYDSFRVKSWEEIINML